MGRIIFGGVSICLLGVVFWLAVGKSYKQKARELRAEKAEIEVRGEALSSWADELEAQEAEIEERASEIEKNAAEIEKTAQDIEQRKAALEKLEEELEERHKNALQATAPARITAAGSTPQWR